MTSINQYNIQNLDCASCASTLERAIQDLPGVNFVSINFATAKLHLDAEDVDDVKEHIRKVEPDVIITRADERQGQINRLASPEFFRIVLSGFLLVVGLLLGPNLNTFWKYVVFGVAYLLTGLQVLVGALRNIRNGKWFDEAFLMSISTLGAVAIGELPEAVTVILFYQIGEFVQTWSVDNTRRSLNALMDIRPETANLQREGKIFPVKPGEVKIGEKIVVRPGERVPLDGVVEKGESQLDTSALTGESRPRRAFEGQEVLSGMVNQTGMLTIRVMKTFEHSSVNKLLELVENAAERKSRTQRFITRFAQIYTPFVVGLALVVAFLPPLITGASLHDWIYRALILLVISCPCALVISIPIGYFGGISAASSSGILVKGANFLDVLAKVRTVVFDKTGTLTRGVFEVIDIKPENGWKQDELLGLAASAEQFSNHPIAKSIMQAFGSHKQLKSIANMHEMQGFGLKAEVEGKPVLVGNDALLHKEGIPHEKCELAGSAVHVALNSEYIGYLTVTDRLKTDAADTIKDLRNLVGVENIVMLTGDQADEAERVAGVLGLDAYKAELLPGEKLVALEEMLEDHEFGNVAFVGDGINDAPVLARADVGIAMGALGSDAAIDTADVVIMTDSPSKVTEAIEIGRRTRRIVYQNILMAFVVKGLFILLGIWGLAGMWQAVFGDVGVTLLAVLNATRVMGSR